MVFLDCGSFICWLTQRTQGAIVCSERESELDVMRQLGCWTIPDPCNRFGDGF
jgi:hypothetical protein